MNVKLNTENEFFLTIDNKKSSFLELDEKLNDIIEERKIDIMEYSIANQYLRAVIKKDKYEYHILEKPSGINKIYCIGEDNRRKSLKFNMPYTIMIVKLCYINGVYKKIGDRIYHSNEPVKKDLSNFLWEWGLSNVYDHTYNICWGTSTLPNIDNQTTYQYIDEFFLGIMNNDLLRNKNINWAKMSSEVIHELDIKQLKKLSYKLKDVMNNNNF